MTLKELKINLKNSLCLLSYYGILHTRTSSGEPQLYVSEPRKWQNLFSLSPAHSSLPKRGFRCSKSELVI